MKKALWVVVHGRVQGVGFRYFLLKQAQFMGIKGWTKNLADGGVETMALGDESALERFLQVIRKGPVGSRVESVEVQWPEGSFEFHDFEIRG
jgi:acylphosphatase